MAKLKSFASRYCVTDGRGFRLRKVDPGDTGGLNSKKAARRWLERGVERLAELQERLYADDRWSLLVLLQAMDAAGKDGTIEHVMSGVNPQGVQVVSFKAPSAEDLDHDFLWRSQRALPERGRIGIHNRSYYEEVLVVRVHEAILRAQKLPPTLVTGRIWKERFASIAALERHLASNGTLVLKFLLHVSKREQARRLLERIDDPRKNWKFSPTDLAERDHWDAYMAAYEEAIRATAAPHAPWYVVPADNKWFTRLVVSSAIVEALEALDLKFPVAGPELKKQLAESRAALARGRPGR